MLFAMFRAKQLATFMFCIFGGVFGQTCSSGVCLPENYNKMDLPGLKPIQIDTQILLIRVFLNKQSSIF